MSDAERIAALERELAELATLERELAELRGWVVKIERTFGEMAEALEDDV